MSKPIRLMLIGSNNDVPDPDEAVLPLQETILSLPDVITGTFYVYGIYAKPVAEVEREEYVDNEVQTISTIYYKFDPDFYPLVHKPNENNPYSNFYKVFGQASETGNYFSFDKWLNKDYKWIAWFDSIRGYERFEEHIFSNAIPVNVESFDLPDTPNEKKLKISMVTRFTMQQMGFTEG